MFETSFIDSDLGGIVEVCLGSQFPEQSGILRDLTCLVEGDDISGGGFRRINRTELGKEGSLELWPTLDDLMEFMFLSSHGCDIDGGPGVCGFFADE